MADYVVPMKPDFTGHTALLYACYRRDLPAEQARHLADLIRLRKDDVVIDLGCGTGQLAVPLAAYCALMVGIDPEPQMLAGLHARREEGVMCVLGDDGDVPKLAASMAGPVGAVVVGNALHWMDEPVALRACAETLRPRGAVAVLTQGPPLWLGSASWQVRVRQILRETLGSVAQTCGSDAATLTKRGEVLRDLGLDVHIATWHASYEVDTDWVLGHLGSALAPEALQDERAGGMAHALRAALDEHRPGVMHEEVTTTAVIARRRP